VQAVPDGGGPRGRDRRVSPEGIRSGRPRRSDDAILDDFNLGRAASAGAMREPLAILARDWDTLHKNKVLSMRLGINVLPGGRQAREGGNSKNTTTARSDRSP
jgi:hypothetical protein